MQQLNLYEIEYTIDSEINYSLTVVAENLDEAATKGLIAAIDKPHNWKPRGERVLTSVTKTGIVYT